MKDNILVITVILNLPALSEAEGFQDLIPLKTRSRNKFGMTLSKFGMTLSKFGMTFLIFLAFNFALLALSEAEGLTFNLNEASASYMSGDNYILQLGTFGTAAGKPTGGDYKLGVTVGQTAPGLYTGTNYKVKAGFQYVYPAALFSFTISQTLIDFGIITPTNPVTRTNSLTISNRSANGYTVTASQTSPLKSSQGATIPDTTCDDGTCTQTTASAWTGTLTYGFGYRCDNQTGTDCATGFTGSIFYKQFADSSNSENAQAVMSGATTGTKKSQITYKINISGTQAAGTYSNIITYIATPTF
ncbi:MAG: hypothetical protein Q7S38_00245 [bacterium]|nr:hypothetical protein [bacterium]